MRKNESAINSYHFIEQSFLDSLDMSSFDKLKSKRREKRKRMFLTRTNFFKKISSFSGFNQDFISTPARALSDLPISDYSAIVSWSKHQKSCRCYMCSKSKSKSRAKGFSTIKRLESCEFQLSIRDEPNCYIDDLEFCENYL